jgi:hypothetical protein
MGASFAARAMLAGEAALLPPMERAATAFPT